MELKGEIPWGPRGVVSILKTGRSWDVRAHTGRAYHLTDMMGDAARWHAAINRALEDWLVRIRAPVDGDGTGQQ